MAVSGLLLGCDLFASPNPTPTVPPPDGLATNTVPPSTPCSPPTIASAQVAVDGQFNSLFANDAGNWLGADGAYSVPLPDGRSVWLFGDTILGKRNPDGSRQPTAFINNSFLVQQGDKLTLLHGGSDVHPSAEITPTNPATWYWTAGGLVEGDKLRVFLIQLQRAGNGTPGFDFTSVGSAIASFALPDLTLDSVAPMPFSSTVQYGDSFIEDSDYTYIYGLEDLQAKKYGHVARVRRGQVLGSWQFYTGAGWSNDPHASARISSDVSNLSVFKQGNGYVLIGMETGFGFGKNIIAYSSCSPLGPWLNRTVLYTVPEATDSVITYLAIAHPEFSTGGPMLISYCLNDTKAQSSVDTSIYRPHFIRVSFAPQP